VGDFFHKIVDAALGEKTLLERERAEKGG